MATTPLPRLAVHGVALAYGARQVVDDVSFELGAGQRLALLGPNGAGKSSLLRCLTGVATGARGTVLLDGSPLADLTRAAVARRIAVVPQLTMLPFAMRVEELVGLGRIPYADPWRGQTPTDAEAVAAAIAQVGLSDLRRRDVRQLSLGERQLALVALALAQSAGLLLLDEPTVHLDIRHRVRVMEVLVELAEEGVSVVAVLHDIGLARHFFPRVLLLDGGRLVADGPPEEVLTAASTAAAFGVEPELLRLV